MSIILQIRWSRDLHSRIRSILIFNVYRTAQRTRAPYTPRRRRPSFNKLFIIILYWHTRDTCFIMRKKTLSCTTSWEQNYYYIVCARWLTIRIYILYICASPFVSWFMTYIYIMCVWFLCAPKRVVCFSHAVDQTMTKKSPILLIIALYCIFIHYT